MSENRIDIGCEAIVSAIRSEANVSSRAEQSDRLHALADLVSDVGRRLAAAEDLAMVYSWCPARHETNRDKAAHELWSAWVGLLPEGWDDRENHEHLSDEHLDALAAKRDRTRSETLARYERLVATDA